MGRIANNLMQTEKEKDRNKARRQKNMSDIAQIAKNAKAEGLSYGQYVNRYLSGQHYEVKE